MANRDLLYIGISGDGDTASIGMGQFAHALRRNLNLNYICMNNGCYGLTKGQDSATADKGSAGKKGAPNPYESIDLCELAIDVISPCVTFNNTTNSTKSYSYVRDHIEATNTFDFVPLQQEILASYEEGETRAVTMHDGSKLHLHKVDSRIDVTNRLKAVNKLEEEKERGRVLTGLLYVNQEIEETHDIINSTLTPLNELTIAELCPGNARLQGINEALR